MIREASLNELPELMLLAEKFHASSAFNGDKFDTENMAFIIETAIASPDSSYALFIADVGEGVKTAAGFISGVMLASFYEPPHSRRTFGIDIAFLSLLPRRGIARTLVNHYSQYCQIRGIKALLGVNMNINNDAGYALLESCGFREAGRTFVKGE